VGHCLDGLALKAAGGPVAAWRMVRQRIRERDRETLLLLYWFLVPLTVFCLARSRLQLYVLPLFVPLRWRRRAPWPRGPGSMDAACE